MRRFLHLLKWDFILLHRNKLIVLSLLVALIYLGLFYLLKDLGDLTSILVVLLFNDPVITGFLFAGVILLFEKNQETLKAIQVSPLPVSHFVISKAIVLGIVSTVIAFIMTFAAYGFNFNYIHLFFGVFGTSIFFIFSGFIAGHYSNTFNKFLLYTIGYVILMALPFVAYAGIADDLYFLIIPSFAGLKLMDAAFNPARDIFIFYGYLYLLITMTGSGYLSILLLKKSSL